MCRPKIPRQRSNWNSNWHGEQILKQPESHFLATKCENSEFLEWRKKNTGYCVLIRNRLAKLRSQKLHSGGGGITMIFLTSPADKKKAQRPEFSPFQTFVRDFNHEFCGRNSRQLFHSHLHAVSQLGAEGAKILAQTLAENVTVTQWDLRGAREISHSLTVGVAMLHPFLFWNQSFFQRWWTPISAGNMCALCI